jgi:GNAT superfamily N-acetyltransferase
MELRELFEATAPSKVLVIFSGGFHPFHSGHASVYQYLRKKFPTADVYVASSNKTTERPFAFKDKQFLASQAGIPADRFVEVASPYRSIEITQKYNPNDTVLIFGLSEKDKDRFGKPFKRDGSPSYFQPFPGSVEKCQPFEKHGYYVVTPTIQFSVLGSNVSSASQIREMYKNADDKTRLDIAEDLYPVSQQIPRVKKILDKVLGSTPITESPDFGYSSFTNRDEDISKLKWSAKNLLPTGEAVGIYARTPDSSSQVWVARMGLQIEEENGKPFRATIRQTTITPEWTGTGLGQLLYDHAIQYAKKRGCEFFCSDIQRTMDAEGAWKRLSRRYPVEKHSNYYLIDLSKV